MGHPSPYSGWEKPPVWTALPGTALAPPQKPFRIFAGNYVDCVRKFCSLICPEMRNLNMNSRLIFGEHTEPEDEDSDLFKYFQAEHLHSLKHLKDRIFSMFKHSGFLFVVNFVQ